MPFDATGQYSVTDLIEIRRCVIWFRTRKLTRYQRTSVAILLSKDCSRACIDFMLPLTWNSWCELPPVHSFTIRVLVDSDPILKLFRSSGIVGAGASLGVLYSSVYPNPQLSERTVYPYRYPRYRGPEYEFDLDSALFRS